MGKQKNTVIRIASIDGARDEVEGGEERDVDKQTDSNPRAYQQQQDIGVVAYSAVSDGGPALVLNSESGRADLGRKGRLSETWSIMGVYVRRKTRWKIVMVLESRRRGEEVGKQQELDFRVQLCSDQDPEVFFSEIVKLYNWTQ